MLNYLKFCLLNENTKVDPPYYLKLTMIDFLRLIKQPQVDLQVKDQLIFYATDNPDNDPVPSIRDNDRTVTIYLSDIPQQYRTASNNEEPVNEPVVDSETESEEPRINEPRINLVSDKNITWDGIKNNITLIEVYSGMFSFLQNNLNKIKYVLGIYKQKSLDQEQVIDLIKNELIKFKKEKFEIQYID